MINNYEYAAIIIIIIIIIINVWNRTAIYVVPLTTGATGIKPSSLSTGHNNSSTHITHTHTHTHTSHTHTHTHHTTHTTDVCYILYMCKSSKILNS